MRPEEIKALPDPPEIVLLEGEWWVDTPTSAYGPFEGYGIARQHAATLHALCNIIRITYSERYEPR